MVSGLVWGQLDPNAGVMGARVRVALAGLAGVALAVGAAWASGVVLPRVSIEHVSAQGSWVHDDLWRPLALTPEVALTLRNDGLVPVTVTGLGADLPGLVVRSASLADGSRVIEAGGRMEVSMSLLVTDCRALPRGDYAVAVAFDQWWGSGAVRAWRDTSDSGFWDWNSVGCNEM